MVLCAFCLCDTRGQYLALSEGFACLRIKLVLYLGHGVDDMSGSLSWAFSSGPLVLCP